MGFAHDCSFVCTCECVSVGAWCACVCLLERLFVPSVPDVCFSIWLDVTNIYHMMRVCWVYLCACVLRGGGIGCVLCERVCVCNDGLRSIVVCCGALLRTKSHTLS